MALWIELNFSNTLDGPATTTALPWAFASPATTYHDENFSHLTAGLASYVQLLQDYLRFVGLLQSSASVELMSRHRARVDKWSDDSCRPLPTIWPEEGSHPKAKSSQQNLGGNSAQSGGSARIRTTQSNRVTEYRMHALTVKHFGLGGKRYERPDCDRASPVIRYRANPSLSLV